MLEYNIIQYVQDDCTYNTNLLNQFKTEIRNLPPGALHFKTMKNSVRFFHYIPSKKRCERGNQIYIARKKSSIISALSKKMFIKISIKEIEKNIEAATKFLQAYSPYNPQEVLNQMAPPYQNIKFEPFASNNKGDFKAWIDEPYDKSNMNLDRLIYSSMNGVKVRSKSESIIASQLEMAGVPYRYEASLFIENRYIYPDFTILNPRDGKIVYWEHFGMADNPEYVASMNRKLADYRKSKILPWKNLIETYEYSDVPFDIQLVKKIISDLLLP